MIDGSNCIVLDLETRYVSTDCRWCLQPAATHGVHTMTGTPDVCPSDWEVLVSEPLPQYVPLGWQDKPALGLSIGCYFSYADMQYHFFDSHTLQETMRRFVTEQTLIVGFNSRSFDLVIMRGLLRREAEFVRLNGQGPLDGWDEDEEYATKLVSLCDAFKAQSANSYDLLAEIWQASPESKMVKGLNTLDAIAQANGMPPKASGGALIPQWWREGRYADVLEHVQYDVRLTKALFEQVLRGEPLRRHDGSQVLLPRPALPRNATAAL